MAEYHPIQARETPTVDSPPMTAVEFRRLCAVNCLYFVKRLCGVSSTYEDIRTVLEPGSTGVSMQRLAETARAYGYGVTPAKLSRREMVKSGSLLIALGVPDNGPRTVGHFYVVVPIPSRNGYWVFDPPRKRTWVSLDQMKKDDNRRGPTLSLKPPRFD